MNEKLPQNQNEFNLDDLLPAEQQPALNTDTLDKAADNMEQKLAAAERAVDVATRDHEAHAAGKATSAEAQERAVAQLPSIPAEMMNKVHNEEAMRRVRANSTMVAMAKGPKPDRSSTDLAMSLFGDNKDKDAKAGEAAEPTEPTTEPAEEKDGTSNEPAAEPQKSSWLRHPVKRFREAADKVIPSDEELDKRDEAAKADTKDSVGTVPADETETRFDTPRLSRSERAERRANAKALMEERKKQQKENGGEGSLINIFDGPKPERETAEEGSSEAPASGRKAVAVTSITTPAPETASTNSTTAEVEPEPAAEPDRARRQRIAEYRRQARVAAAPEESQSTPSVVVSSGAEVVNGLSRTDQEQLAAFMASLPPAPEAEPATEPEAAVDPAATVPMPAVTPANPEAATTPDTDSEADTAALPVVPEAAAHTSATGEAEAATEPETEPKPLSLDELPESMFEAPAGAKNSSEGVDALFAALDRQNGRTTETEGEQNGSIPPAPTDEEVHNALMARYDTPEEGEEGESNEEDETRPGRMARLRRRLGRVVTGNWRNESAEERQARFERENQERQERRERRYQRDAEQYDRRQNRTEDDTDESSTSVGEDEGRNPERRSRRNRLALKAGGALLAGAALLGPASAAIDHTEARPAPAAAQEAEQGNVNPGRIIDTLDAARQGVANQAKAAEKAAEHAADASEKTNDSVQIENATDTVEKKGDNEVIVTLKQDGNLYQAGIDGGLNDTEVMNAINNAHITDEMARSFQVGQQFDFHKDNGEWEVKVLR